MFYDAWMDILSFMERGGNVLWLIALVAFVMWTLIIERVMFFQTEFANIIRRSTERWEARTERRSWTAHQVRDCIVSEASQAIQGSMPVILTCVALSPLLGLLGTVTGMISVFDAMATQGGNARSMAAGVSMATIPTMAGMMTSLSGLFAATYLNGRIQYETELFEDHLTLDH